MTEQTQSINLKEFPLFQDLDETVAHKFISIGFRFAYKSGMPIVVSDDQGETFFLILTGVAKIELKNKSGPQLNVTLLRTGDFFGELSILENEPTRTASVIAATDVEVVALQKKDFIRLVHEHPTLGLNIARVLGLRLRAMNDRVTTLMLPTENRIARTLLYLAEKGKAFSEEGPILLPHLPLKEWSLFCHAPREEFMATMEKFRQMGILEWQNQRVVVKDLSILTEYATVKDPTE